MMPDLLAPLEGQSLSEFLKMVLDQRHISGNALSKMAGVAETTVRNLLKQGDDPDAPGPHPLVLRHVCEALGLDQVRVFQLANYITPDYEPIDLSPGAEYLGYCYDLLTPEKQKVLSNLVSSLLTDNASALQGEQIEQLLEAVRLLRKQHPFFSKKNFGPMGEIGHWLGQVVLQEKNQAAMEWMIENRLQKLLDDPTLTIARIKEIVERPQAFVVLNTLFPHKRITSSFEKFYWLTHPGGTREKQSADLPAYQQAAIKALWALLVQVTQ